MEPKFYEDVKKDDICFVPPPCPVCGEQITTISFSVLPSPRGGWCVAQWHLVCNKCGAKTEATRAPRGMVLSFHSPESSE